MPASVNIVDRASLTQGLYKELVLDPKQTAIVTIDMHRGHLDMDVATMPARPEDAKRVIANARAMLDFARAQGMAVIHVILVYRRIPGLGSEGMVSPFWKAMHSALGEQDRLTPGRKSTVSEHNIEGSPGTEIIPELYRPGDYMIDNKKRRRSARARTAEHRALPGLGDQQRAVLRKARRKDRVKYLSSWI